MPRQLRLQPAAVMQAVEDGQADEFAAQGLLRGFKNITAQYNVSDQDCAGGGAWLAGGRA